jgi:REP element-mobilizing transposase RayT
MPSTHVCLYVHVIFSTKDRRALIASAWRERLHAYIGGTIRSLNGIAAAVGGTSDHVHLLIGRRATHRLADVVREVKSASSRWVHECIGVSFFAWQDGYGALSVSVSSLQEVKRYIANQEEHHQTRRFQEEYVALLRAHGVEYDEEYLW